MSDRPNVVRIVHLQGGLRAVDTNSDKVFVQAHAQKRFLHFPTPAYANLYASLKSLGFDVLGVEFVANRPFSAPDWWFAPPEGRFTLMEASRAWGEMQHLADTENKPNLSDICRRCTATLELLQLRLFQMSLAYNGAYLAQAGDGVLPEDHLFDNTFTHHVEAAIHAFLADAINLRNIIFEFCWCYVLRQNPMKASFKQLRAKARSIDNAFALDLVDAGEGGWLKRLSDLRDSVFHIAPIGAQNFFPPLYTRRVALPDGGAVSYVAYGLIDRNSDEKSFSDFRDEDGIKAELANYKARLDESDDALQYAWVALGKLVALCEAGRLASGLKGKALTLGPEDIISLTIDGVTQ